LRGVGGLCRIRFTFDRIKASPEATGRALQGGNAVAKPRTGLFSPIGRAAANVIRFGISVAARSLIGKMVGTE